MRYWANNVEPLVSSKSTLEHRRTKWTKKLVHHSRFSKIYYFKENQNLSTMLP